MEVSNAEAVAVWYGSIDSTTQLITVGDLCRKYREFLSVHRERKCKRGVTVTATATVKGCYLKMRLESELCFGTRNGDRVGFDLPPAANFAFPEAAERKKDRAATADIVSSETARLFNCRKTSSRGFSSHFHFFYSFGLLVWVWYWAEMGLK